MYNNFNPLKIAIQKFLMEMLKERYTNHAQVIERMCHYLVTEQDAKQFSAFAADLYQLGFARATKEYTQKLAEQGFKLEIIDAKTMDDGQKDNK